MPVYKPHFEAHRYKEHIPKDALIDQESNVCGKHQICLIFPQDMYKPCYLIKEP